LVIKQKDKLGKLELSGTVTRGNLLGYSSGWVAADANVAAGPIYAQWIALEDGVDGDEINVCRGAVFEDLDEPYTINTAQYLSGTAGAITETKPATDGDLIQIVGWALSTSRVRIDLAQPREETFWFEVDTYDTTTLLVKLVLAQ